MTRWLIRLFIKDSEDTSKPAVRAAYGNLACVAGILCNLLLFAGKFTVGTLFGSVAIAADGMNNLSDAGSSVVSLIGFRLGARPADDKHPFGHARYEYLAGLAVSVMIMVIGVELLKESVAKLIHPTAVEFGLLTGAVLVASILLKVWISLFNRRIGNLIGSETLIATAADARNDVVSTSAVLVASLAASLTGIDRLDGLAGLAVAVFILYSGFGLVRDTLDPILGAAPDPALIRHIEEKVMTYPGVLGIHDLIVHDYGPGRQFASLHVEMGADVDVLESHDIIDQIERRFLKDYNLHVIIHYDPVIKDNGEMQQTREFLSMALKKLDPRLTLHDLRMVPGPSHTNLIFDVVTPHDFEMQDCRLKAEIQQIAKNKNPQWNCMVTVEHSFV